LQQLGKTYSPAIKNAIAAYEASRAAAYQAGMYPNPVFGYEHDTVETGPAGYPGGFIDQLVKTGGKLTVAQAAATMDILTAKLTLRRANADLRTQIRGFYFAVLVAQETVRVNEAMFQFLQEIYQFQASHAAGGIPPTGPYDPFQLRPTVLQAQLNIIAARNAYHAAWRQLVAAIGLPDMCPTQLEGSITGAMPCLDYHEILQRLDKHTDVLSAEVGIHKAKYNLLAAKLVPLPDVDVRVLVQKDYTTYPNQISHSFVLNMPIPLWDQNRGGIRQAQWQLAQAAVGPAQARNTLVGTLAEAYGRYLTARKQVEITMAQIRDQVRYYRGLQGRWKVEQAALIDLFVAQQTLAGYITGYVTALGLQWQAIVDVSNLLQAEDLYAVGPPMPMPPIPDLNCLQPPPSPLPDPPGPLALFPKSASAAPVEDTVGPGPEGPPGAPPPPPGGPMPGQMLPIAPPQAPGKERPNDQ
jgi:cobalt-zinc-cadmium efflux system outer membrane protein